MFLNGFSIGNVWGNFEVAYLTAVAPIKVLYVALPLIFGGLHNDIIFVMRLPYRKLLKK